MKLYHNGALVKSMQMQGYEEFIPGKMLKLKFARNLEGFISDFNIYSYFFSEEQNKAWTICKTQEKGDIFPWKDNHVSNLTILNPVEEDENLGQKNNVQGIRR